MTYIFLEKGKIYFFWKDNFDLVKCIPKSIYTENVMERWREGFHQKGKIYQEDLFSWCIPGRLKLPDVIVTKCIIHITAS